jgi:hypothetical protein
MKQIPTSASLYTLLLTLSITVAQAQIIIDHTYSDITKVPTNWMTAAKQQLHIAYGRTSHGSQLTSGMTGLVEFANGGGKGLNLPENFFAWNNGGIDGALDLHDGAMSKDVGYYPDWIANTTNYLNNPANADVNVIMWAWCGQVEDKYRDNKLYAEYLTPMSQLEEKYPHVTFVYMTGHVDIGDDADNKAANDVIRNFCIQNKKVLYDFADIERYDPDGTYYEFVDDSCVYFDSAGGTAVGNWARNWQNAHVEGVDWYNCTARHSQPLNANQKAYAAWALFARLAGWSGLLSDSKDISYDTWKTNQFTQAELDDPSISGLHADPDNDGILNFAEYALDLDPKTNSHFEVTPAPNSGFTYRRRPNAQGVSFVVQYCTSLGEGWTTLQPEDYSLQTAQNSDGSEQVTVNPTQTDTNAFLRLQIKIAG